MRARWLQVLGASSDRAGSAHRSDESQVEPQPALRQHPGGGAEAPTPPARWQRRVAHGVLGSARNHTQTERPRRSEDKGTHSGDTRSWGPRRQTSVPSGSGACEASSDGKLVLNPLKGPTASRATRVSVKKPTACCLKSPHTHTVPCPQEKRHVGASAWC